MIMVDWIMGNIRWKRICEMNRQDITTAGIKKKIKSLVSHHLHESTI